MRIPDRLPPSSPIHRPHHPPLPRHQREAAIKSATYSALSTEAKGVGSTAPTQSGGLPADPNPNIEAYLLFAELDLELQNGNSNMDSENGTPDGLYYALQALGPQINASWLQEEGGYDALMKALYVGDLAGFRQIWSSNSTAVYNDLMSQMGNPSSMTSAQSLNFMIFMTDYSLNNPAGAASFWNSAQGPMGGPISSQFPNFVLSYLYTIDNPNGPNGSGQFMMDSFFICQLLGNLPSIVPTPPQYLLDMGKELNNDFITLKNSNWDLSSIGITNPYNEIVVMNGLIAAFLQGLPPSST
jgi:hypothetical protein